MKKLLLKVLKQIINMNPTQLLISCLKTGSQNIKTIFSKTNIKVYMHLIRVKADKRYYNC